MSKTIIGYDRCSQDGPSSFTGATDAAFIYSRIDIGCEALRKQARALDIPFGAYLPLRWPIPGWPSVMPWDQVGQALDLYDMQDAGELPVGLDIEFPSSRASTGLSAEEAMEWANEAYQALTTEYGEVMVYTSRRVWVDELANLPAGPLGDAALWVKTGYLYAAREPIHLESMNFEADAIPAPWHAGAWIQQFQGDATGAPGFEGYVDVNRWLPAIADQSGHIPPSDPRAGYVAKFLNGATVPEYQNRAGLVPDGVIGPKTFAALTAHRAK